MDETVESATPIIADKKVPKKIENSSTALEKNLREKELENNDNSLLETDIEDLNE